MRHLAIWRLAALLLLAAIPLAAPTLAGSAPAAFADNGNQGNGNDGNRGHGNEPDGHDEDNPGNSSGPGKKKDKDDAGNEVETIPAGYVVDVACETGDVGGATCTFTASAPAGAKKVGFLQVPAENLCADVIDTDAKYTDPEPHTRLAGYTSSGGDKETVTIVFDEPVTTGGTATYWIKAGGSVFPVDGPGLRCDRAAASATGTSATATVQFEVTPTATPVPSTGTVAVTVLSCAGDPADTTDFDWFGACPPGIDPPREFTLAPSDGGAAAVTATTDETGEATFASVSPGEYQLDLVDGSWCHAVSDRVTADSAVVVEAGVTSTVWIFVCDSPAGV